MAAGKLTTEQITIRVTLITAVAGIITALIAQAGLLKDAFTPPTTTPSATILPPTSTSTIIPTYTPSPTSTFPPTSTPPPPPLVEIFPQVDGGKEFVYINAGGVLNNNFMPNAECIHSGIYGLLLTYSMGGAANGGWGVQWNDSPAKHFDASSFDTLLFWVKGSSGGESFQVGLKDATGKEVKVESKTILIVTSDWQLAKIPFSEFKGINITSIVNINLGFNKNHGSGNICVDDIAFIKNL